ncbi:LysM peptidoglycan-binding domain-containing protein [Bacillus cereus]|nr:LysM peptidoglycan-binding domain-containing protein [Bacillus cereus]EKS8355581.1 LysM peptidoglycan-binding domain-containing protein [Bacillus cereus]
MAQYQRNFYSSSLYGRLKAFYGDYLTEEFDAQEPFSYHIDAKIQAQLPSTFYAATSREFKRIDSAKWTVSGKDIKTRTANTPVEFVATGDNLEVHVRLQNVGTQNIEAKLYKEELVAEAYQWVEKQTKSINTLSLTNPNKVDKIAFDSYGFGDYKVIIKALDTTADAIIVGGKLRTSDFNIEIRTSANKTTWSKWEPITLNKKLIQGQNYLSTGQSVTLYKNVRYVQGKIILLSSDNATSPIIDRVELRSEDSGLYDQNGDYTVKIDMTQVATSVGKSFKHVDKIRFIQRQPAGTEMNIRSSSSRDNIFWGPITAPYRQNTKRLRLKRGATNHSVTLGPINEGSKFDFSKTTALLSWDTQAFSPKDASNTKITYIFSKTRTNQKDPRNLLQVIDNPMNVKDRAIKFSPQPYFLTVEMTRSSARGTPVVDLIDVYQNILYKEVVNIINKDVSAVDGLSTGRKSLQKISDYPFKYPSISNQIPFNQQQITAAQQKYELTDQTRRPSDVMLYLKSEENKGARTGKSTSASDEIIAKAIQRKLEFGDKTGVLMHYQYGAGKVQYLRPYERELDSTFTPFLLPNLKYRYYIKNGWPNEVHKVVNGQTLNDVAEMYNTTVNAIKGSNKDILLNEDTTLVKDQLITIPNTSKNDDVSLLFKNGTVYTQKSSHNSVYDKDHGLNVTDLSSEPISIKVPNTPPKGYVDWASEEKIYTGVINANDIRGEFVRTQFNLSTLSDFDREYVVANGDTWESIASKYDIYVQDLRATNNSIEELKVGNTIIIPPNIILPALAPEAEFEDAMPYKISIIEDSVHKKDGVRIDESFVPIDWNGKHLPLEVTYRTSELLTAEMVRGSDANGMDPLPLSDVIEIVSCKKKNGSVTYHIWNDTLKTGDFKLKSNYIDWSPSQAGVLEPAPGEEYVVVYKRREVDSVKVHLDTTYFEKVGTDIVWRSPEVKVFDGVCTPTEDFKLELPTPQTFEGYDGIYKNISYIIEDNDLWVETSVQDIDGKKFLVGTLNGKDPRKNWHPEIQKGYYYLKEQEHYLYSEPLKTVLAEKELPTADGIEYVKGPTGMGAMLLPASSNIVRDSVFENDDWQRSKVFNATSF